MDILVGILFIISGLLFVFGSAAASQPRRTRLLVGYGIMFAGAGLIASRFLG